jgi:hypothetical protein
MTSRLKEDDTRRWFLPVIEYLGKLGQPNGPSLASVMELAQLRKTFLAGGKPALEIEGPPAPPALPKSPSYDGPIDGPIDGPPSRRRTIATPMTTSTTSTLPPEEAASANGAWNR